MKSNIIILKNILYPIEYESNYIYAHVALNDELKDLIAKSGYVDKLKKDYLKTLRFLENLKVMCIIMDKNKFEKLKDANGLYAMRLKGEKNIRILFMFTRMNNHDIAILLTCFQEKDKDDYKSAIQLANIRKVQLTEGK